MINNQYLKTFSKYNNYLHYIYYIIYININKFKSLIASFSKLPDIIAIQDTWFGDN